MPMAVYIVLFLVFLAATATPLARSAPTGGNSSRLVPDKLSFTATVLRSDLKCEVCKLVAGLAREVVDLKRTEEEVVKLATEICIDGHIEDENVCTQAVLEFKDEVFGVLEQGVLEPADLCGCVVVPGCGPCSLDYQQWNVSLPDTPKPPVLPVNPPQPGSPVNRILHLSDIHYDREYTPGLSNNCSEPLCCRPPNEKGSGTTAAGPWGDYQCDIPLQTLENLLQHLKDTQDEFDWIYLTGDLPAHNVWHQSRSDQIEILKDVMDLFRKYLPNKPLFPSVGNHESAPVNSFPPPYVTGNASNQWLLDALSKQWSGLPKDALETVKKGGYYSVKVREGLRVISLQTNYGQNGNYWLIINSTDPAGQLAWLVEQLQEAEDQGDKVHIIGHIPNKGLIKSWSWSYYNIINRYESTVVGQFFGHTHKDSFSLFFDETNTSRPVGVQYIGPSVTTYQGVNPGYHIYTIDGGYNGTTNAVLDFEGYYLNITDANLSNDPKWVFEYRAKAAYQMAALQPSDWSDLVYRLLEDDKLFHEYYEYYFKMGNQSPCDDKCRAGYVCDLTRGRGSDPRPCPSLPPGVTMSDIEAYWTVNESC